MARVTALKSHIPDSRVLIHSPAARPQLKKCPSQKSPNAYLLQPQWPRLQPNHYKKSTYKPDLYTSVLGGPTKGRTQTPQPVLRFPCGPFGPLRPVATCSGSENDALARQSDPVGPSKSSFWQPVLQSSGFVLHNGHIDFAYAYIDHNQTSQANHCNNYN